MRSERARAHVPPQGVGASPTTHPAPSPGEGKAQHSAHLGHLVTEGSGQRAPRGLPRAGAGAMASRVASSHQSGWKAGGTGHNDTHAAQGGDAGMHVRDAEREGRRAQGPGDASRGWAPRRGPRPDPAGPFSGVPVLWAGGSRTGAVLRACSLCLARALAWAPQCPATSMWPSPRRDSAKVCPVNVREPAGVTKGAEAWAALAEDLHGEGARQDLGWGPTPATDGMLPPDSSPGG